MQHALRAFTPRDQKAVKATAQTMRANPGLDVQSAITELAVGEALISLLDEKGRPGITQRLYVQPPGSRIGPATEAERQALRQQSLVAGVYEQAVDRESAYEVLKARAGSATGATGTGAAEEGGVMGELLTKGRELLFGRTGPRGGQYDGLVQSMIKSEARRLGRNLLRGALGSLLGGSKRR